MSRQVPRIRADSKTLLPTSVACSHQRLQCRWPNDRLDCVHIQSVQTHAAFLPMIPLSPLTGPAHSCTGARDKFHLLPLLQLQSKHSSSSLASSLQVGLPPNGVPRQRPLRLWYILPNGFLSCCVTETVKFQALLILITMFHVQYLTPSEMPLWM